MASPAVRWITSGWWTLERFGLTPGKAPRRLLNRGEPAVFCITVPKSGTHLLERVLCLHPRLYRKAMPTIHSGNIKRRGGLGRLLGSLGPGQIMLAHLPFTEPRNRVVRSSGVRSMFLVRDPRDVVVSEVFYLTSRKDHPLHERFARQAGTAARIRLALEGSEDVPSLSRILIGSAGWLDHAGLVVRFEDLVGPAGGGNETRQRETLESIFAYLEVEAASDWIASTTRRAFSDRSPTFRRGAIGAWRRYFDPSIEGLFNELAGEALVRYGYADG